MKRHWLNERRLDYRAGIVAALLYNANRDPKKDSKGKDWTDFFPDPFDTREAPEVIHERLRAQMLALLARHGGVN